jgi:prepilin peptidase CpaA
MTLLWLTLFIVFCACTCYFDVRYRRVPNWLIISLLLYQSSLLFALHFWRVNLNGSTLFIDGTTALVGLTFSLVLFFPLWRFKAMGAGDVKFMAVLGFCIGLSGLFPALIIGSLLAGVHAVAAIMAKGWSGARAIWRLAPDVRR